MKPILKLCKPYIAAFVALVVFTYVAVMMSLRLPDYSANIVNKGIILQDLGSIWTDGRMMIVVALIGGVCTIASVFFAARIATGLARDVRRRVFAQIENLAIADFNQFSTASLITRSTNDIQQIQMTLMMLLRFALMAPLMAVGGIQKALENAPNLTWIIASAVAGLLIIIVMLFAVAVPRFKKLQQLVDKLNLVTRENLTGLRVVRAFHNEKIEQTKFQRVNNELNGLNLFVNRLMMVLDPVMMLVMNLTSIAVVWFGAWLVDAGTLEIGNMMAFLQYAMQVIISFLMISMVFIMVPRAAVSVRRVSEILDTQPSITDPKQPNHLPADGVGKIEFRDVTFSYPGADLPVLSGINFTAEPGQTTAFIGSTGSGKSTLINLIPRFYDVSAGQVFTRDVDAQHDFGHGAGINVEVGFAVNFRTSNAGNAKGIAARMLGFVEDFHGVDVLDAAAADFARQHVTVAQDVYIEVAFAGNAQGKEKGGNTEYGTVSEGFRAQQTRFLSGEAVGRGVADEAARRLELIHHVVAGINTGGTGDAFELQAVTDVNAGRADLHTHGAINTIPKA